MSFIHWFIPWISAGERWILIVAFINIWFLFSGVFLLMEQGERVKTGSFLQIVTMVGLMLLIVALFFLVIFWLQERA